MSKEIKLLEKQKENENSILFPKQISRNDLTDLSYLDLLKKLKISNSRKAKLFVAIVDFHIISDLHFSFTNGWVKPWLHYITQTINKSMPVQISIGGNHTLILSSKNQLHSFGLNNAYKSNINQFETENTVNYHSENKIIQVYLIRLYLEKTIIYF